MAAKRHLDLHLVRLLPHPLRDDFVTVGFLLRESDGGFADVRVTRDWKTLQCVAPEVEPEWFDFVEREIRGQLARAHTREELLDLLTRRFGMMLDVGPTKAVLTDDPVKEMEVLTGIYLTPRQTGGAAAHERTGRGAILHTMKEAFEQAGVLELMQKNLDVAKYTEREHGFAIDFGYRIGADVKMFQAVSMTANTELALRLALRYSRVAAGMQREQLRPSLTAVVNQEIGSAKNDVRFAVEALEDHAVRVRTVGEMETIAHEVRMELRA